MSMLVSDMQTVFSSRKASTGMERSFTTRSERKSSYLSGASVATSRLNKMRRSSDTRIFSHLHHPLPMDTLREGSAE